MNSLTKREFLELIKQTKELKREITAGSLGKFDDVLRKAYIEQDYGLVAEITLFMVQNGAPSTPTGLFEINLFLGNAIALGDLNTALALAKILETSFEKIIPRVEQKHR